MAIAAGLPGVLGPMSRLGRRRSARRDRYDGYLPGRLLLVGAVAVAVVCVDHVPQPLVGRVGRHDDSGCAVSALAPDLNLYVWIRSEVVQPRRVTFSATTGCDHEIIVAVACVDQAVSSSRARATPGRAQQEGGNADYAVTKTPVGSFVELLMNAQDLAP